MPDPTKPSRGVRKLREAEAKAGKQIVMEQRIKEAEEEELQDDTSTIAAGEAFPMKDMPSVSA